MSQTLQEIVQNMLNGVVTTLNQPGTQWYLPTWLTANGYDPYGTNRTLVWSFTLNSQDMLVAAGNICSDIGVANPDVCASYKDFYIADPANAPLLTLGGTPNALLISGASNAVVTALTAQGNDIPMPISGQIQLSTQPNLPSQISITGNFSLLQHCCCSTDQSTCDAASLPYTGAGTFEADIVGTSTCNLSVQITQISPGVLTLNVSSITLIPPTSGGVPVINTTVNITSMPAGANVQSYNNLAEEAFNDPAGKQHIVDQINAVLNQPEQLQAINTALTQVVDSYLKSNNLYPFNNASYALF